MGYSDILGLPQDLTVWRNNVKKNRPYLMI